MESLNLLQVKLMTSSLSTIQRICTELLDLEIEMNGLNFSFIQHNVKWVMIETLAETKKVNDLTFEWFISIEEMEALQKRWSFLSYRFGNFVNIIEVQNNKFTFSDSDNRIWSLKSSQE